MLKVYDKNTTDFNNNGLAVLNTATNVVVTRELNGEFKLSFDFPVDDGKWEHLKQRNIVLCEGQQFRIYQKARQKAGTITRSVECLHVIADASNMFVPSFAPQIGQTPRDIIVTAFQGTNFHIMTEAEVNALGMQWVTTPTDIMQQSKTNPTTILKQLIENLQKGELYIDNFKIALVERIGKDTGLHYTLSNNLQSIGDNEEGSGIITRLYAYGKDGLPLPSNVAPNGYIDSAEGIENYGIIGGHIDYDTIENPEELYQKALWEFNPNNPKRIDIPNFSYTAKVIELYKLYGDNFRVKLGDSMILKSKTMGIDTVQRIVKYTYYPYSPQDSDITFGRPPKTYADVLKSTASSSSQYNKTVSQNGQMKVAWIESLIVGKNVIMGADAYISWDNVTDQPTIPELPSYITSTKITQTTIESPTIAGGIIVGGIISGGIINVTTDINVGNNVNLGSLSALTDKYIHFYGNNGNYVDIGMQSDGLLDISGYNGIQLYDFGQEIKIYSNGHAWIHGNRYFKIEATLGISTDESIIQHNGSGALSIKHNGSGNIVFNKVPLVNSLLIATQSYVSDNFAPLNHAHAEYASSSHNHDGTYIKIGAGGGKYITQINASAYGISVHCSDGTVLNFIKD